MQARRWRVTFEVEFRVPATRADAYRWFFRFHRWLESKFKAGALATLPTIKLEPVNPEPEAEEEPVDYYEEVGF